MAAPKLEKVEIKSTIEGPDANDALDALDLDIGDSAAMRLVAFCDLRTADGTLALDDANLIIRFRLDAKGPGEVTVKIRPAPDDVSAWAATNDTDEDKLEEDWSPTGRADTGGAALLRPGAGPALDPARPRGPTRTRGRAVDRR